VKQCRYKQAVGKFAVHPLNGRRIPIVADSVLVDMAFGTGAVKITPAHDPNDFETGKRHKLEFINMLTDEGCINQEGGRFQGLPRFQVAPRLPFLVPNQGEIARLYKW
jgi:valyl-tRNA synthetase